MSTKLQATNRNPMPTRSKNGIFKPKVFATTKEPDSIEEPL